MKAKNRRWLLFLELALCFCPQTSPAKSLVINLTNGTSIYYKLTSDAPPRMVIQSDGTFTLNTAEYNFSDVESFEISATDYNGDEGTTDAVVGINDGQVGMEGEPRIYSMDGRMVRSDGNMQTLPKGIYVISNGKNTFKIMKP